MYDRALANRVSVLGFLPRSRAHGQGGASCDPGVPRLPCTMFTRMLSRFARVPLFMKVISFQLLFGFVSVVSFVSLVASSVDRFQIETDRLPSLILMCTCLCSFDVCCFVLLVSRASCLGLPLHEAVITD